MEPPKAPTPAEIADLIQTCKRIIESVKRGSYPLSKEDTQLVSLFVGAGGRKTDPDMMQLIDRITRQYKQHLLAMAYH
jgi:hypothetical protein